MSDFRPIRKWKKERFMPSFGIACAQHCAMDALLEELCRMKDANALVVGVGECSYYSRKMPFEEGRNWAFELTDRELVFGDLSNLCAALEEIGSNGLTTVCIVTCIPSIMNLGLDELRGAVVVKAPDFTGFDSYDILSDLYCRLSEGVPPAEGGVTVWEGDFESISAFRANLKTGVHIVRDRRYLSAARQLKNATVFDDTSLHSLSVYREKRALLGISESALGEAERIAEKIKAVKEPVSVKCARAYDYACFLKGEGIAIGQVVFDGMNAYAYEKCTALPEAEISADYAATPTCGRVFDLSPYDGEILARTGFDRLLFLLKRTEELCL